MATKIIVRIIVAILPIISVLCEEVCYDDLGCFSNDPPYDLLPGFPPESPDVVNVRFFLYTRLNRDLWMEVDRKEPESLATSLFNPARKTLIYIHGWNNVGYKSSFAVDLTNALLDAENANVFIIDWTGGSDAPYNQAIQNARITGREVAYFIQFLHNETDIPYSRFHLMGSSLGAHASGFVGENQPGIGRISAFDPAGPFFRGQDPALRLDQTDAEFVDVIHTDAESALRLGLGMLQPMGHADFYPNGGKEQAGCPKNITDHIDDFFRTSGCSHSRAPLLFLDSLDPTTGCELTSYPCSSWENFQAGLCSDCGRRGVCPVMGYYAERSRANGLLYLDTGSVSPYCVLDEA
ncbi:pancreatic triacylglycerol lipase-like [Amphiura filiformis]|uniref:pancreatic triacylglycerol lipase-like n=1 Tax=Amphiura filiformis TaxID=82378 RepID=UPI003B226126